MPLLIATTTLRVSSMFFSIKVNCDPLLYTTILVCKHITIYFMVYHVYVGHAGVRTSLTINRPCRRHQAQPTRDWVQADSSPKVTMTLMDTKLAVMDAASAIEPIRPAARSSTSDIVYERLREVILNVTILPNAVLSENDLANTLQVSRTPIRAAIHRLSGEGLIYVVPQVGTFVAPMDLARIREALFMREAVECAAMDRLPNPIPIDAIDALNTIVATHKQAANDRDLKQTLNSDEDFHRLLLELAGVKGVWRYVHDVRETHRRVRVLAQSEFDAALRSAHQHAEIVAALAASNRPKAKGLLGDHIRMNLAYTEEIAQKHPAFFTTPMNSAQPVAIRKF